MPTRGGRPWGARGISRSFLGKCLNFFFRTFSMRAWIGHLFKYVEVKAFLNSLHVNMHVKVNSNWHT